MAGELIEIDLLNIPKEESKFFNNIFDLKKYYIKKYQEINDEKSDNYMNNISIDKLILVNEEDGEELRPNEKKLLKFFKDSKNASNEYIKLLSIVIPPYIDRNCLEMKTDKIENKSHLKYNECLKIEKIGEEITMIDSISLQPQFIYFAYGDTELPQDGVTFFTIKYIYNHANNVVLLIGSIQVRFVSKEEDEYSFKYDPIEKKLFYISKSGIAKSLCYKNLDKESQNNDNRIRIKIENPGYRGNPCVYIMESKRHDVDKFDNVFK
jgi:hypothetical protein